MATTTFPPDAPLTGPVPVGVEQYIDERLLHTRRHMKRVEVLQGVLTLGVGVVGYLLAVAVIDHWLVSGGLGFLGRFLGWLVLIGVGGAYFARRVLPPLTQRISLVFAAHTLERGTPNLKNSLINFLLMRGHVSEAVLQTLEQRAACDLTHVETETAVDAKTVIHRGYILSGVFAVFALYLMLSPKSPLDSAVRVLWPWASVAAPSRVTISDITPGDAVRFYGETVQVSAAVRGVRSGEPVELIFNSADGQIVDQIIPMAETSGAARYAAKLPPGSLGLQQDCDYRIRAGDSLSPLHKITVQVAPAIVVESVRYDYPSYTGLAPRTVEREGDLRALEGTKVTIHATANQPIDRAEIDLDCSGKPGVRMAVDTADPTRAAVQYVLRRSKADPQRADHESYQLRFTDAAGRTNPQPIRHQIEVLADLPPTVQFIEPRQEETQLPLHGRMGIVVKAQDPDFGLQQVILHAKREKESREIELPPLLAVKSGGKAFAGEFVGAFTFEPAKLKLEPGDRILVWAEAQDGKQPQPNRSETEKRQIEIIADENRSAAGEPPLGGAGEGRKGGAPGEGVEGDDAQPGEGAKGEAPSNSDGAADDANAAAQRDDGQAAAKEDANDAKGENASDVANSADGSQGKSSDSRDGAKNNDANNGQNNQAAENREPIDSETDPGQAIEEILKDRKEQEKQQKQDQGKQDQGKQDQGKQDQGKQDQGKQDQGKQDQGKQDQGKQDQGKKNDKQDGTAKESKPGEKKGDKPQDDENGQQQNKEQSKDKGKEPAKDQQGNTKQGQSGSPKNEKNPKTPDQPLGKQDKGASGGAAGQEKPKDGDEQQQPDGTPKNGESGAKSDQTKSGPKSDESNPEAKSDQSQDGNQANPGTEGKPSDKNDQSGKPDAQKEGQDAVGQKGSEKSPQNQKGTDSAQEKATPTDKAKPGENKPKEEQGQEGQLNREDQSAGAGKESDSKEGPPDSQEANRAREKQMQDSGGKPEKKDEGQSPSGSKKQSDSAGDTSGDQSGGGKQGGGQQANQPGMGSPGSNTSAEDGAGQAKERGKGEVGPNAGSDVPSTEKTGQSAIRKDGENGSKGGRPQPGQRAGKGQLAEDQPSDQSDGTPTDQVGGQSGTKPAEDKGNTQGQGNPTAGGKPGEAPQAAPSAPQPPSADPANLEFANKQTSLALEHLRDQLDRDKPELLDRLGWSPEEARRFLDRWEQLQRAAKEPGARGVEAKRELDDALRSLGLRQKTTDLRGTASGREQMRDLRTGSRFTPPAEWSEQVREYHRGVANGGR